MNTADYCTLPEAAPRLGVCYMTVYRWVQSGKLPTEDAFGRQVISLNEIRRYVVRRCSNCYHGIQKNGATVCACRELSDTQTRPNKCPDWKWKWS